MRYLVQLSLVISASLLTACGSGSGSTSVLPNISAQGPSCQCCSGSPSCDMVGAGSTGADSTAAHYASSALGALNAAEKLVGAPNQFAATAVDMTSKGNANTGTLPNSSFTAGGAAALKQIAGGGSGGSPSGAGGAGAGGGMGSLGGDVRTAAAVSLGTTETTMAPNTESNASYAGKGGGGSASSAGGSGTNPFAALFGGDGAASAGASGVNKVSFTGPRDPATAVTSSADPADYFSRINEHDNLFKVVERRYQRETMNWAAATTIKK